jgi:hypothetical protein
MVAPNAARIISGFSRLSVCGGNGTLPSTNFQISPIEYSWSAGVQQAVKTAASYIVIAIAVAVALWTVIHALPFL